MRNWLILIVCVTCWCQLSFGQNLADASRLSANAIKTITGIKPNQVWINFTDQPAQVKHYQANGRDRLKEKAVVAVTHNEQASEVIAHHPQRVRDEKKIAPAIEKETTALEVTAEQRSNHSCWLEQGKQVCVHPDCADGACVPTANEKSQDVGKSLSQAGALLGSAQSAKEHKLWSRNSPSVFPGQSMECSENMMGFKNCCKSSGWGKGLGLAHCSSDEKNLGRAREDERTVYVGRYCAHHSWLFGCTSHHRVFCVFDSHLSTQVQKQGRHGQLHLGFGDVGGRHSEPNCRGLTPDELSRLDFAALDLSSIEHEFVSRVNTITKGQAEQKAREQVEHSTMRLAYG